MEDATDDKLSEGRFEQEQKLRYYSALVSSWTATKMEADKTIVAISAGGIGLLVALLRSTAALTPAAFVLYVVAIFAFLLAILGAVLVFARNAKFVVKVIRGAEESDPLLGALDWLVRIAFLLALLASSALGAAEAIAKLLNKGA